MPRTSRPLRVHPIVLRRAEVARVVDVTPNTRRLTLTGDDLTAGVMGEGYPRPPFRSDGFDDHVKIVVPPDDGPVPHIGTQQQTRFAWNPGVLASTRDYTVLAWDPEANTFDVDVVRHDHGLASAWAYRARPGDEIHFAGPKSCALRNDEVDWHLLVGGQTALPAIGRWLEEALQDMREDCPPREGRAGRDGRVSDVRHAPPGPALAALGALLDRSLSQIADAVSDPSVFDRRTVRTAADVWDNNTLPLFRAATGPFGNERERRARAALEWMARLGPERRAWMVEQGAAAGHRIDALLGPEQSPGPARRVGASFPLRRIRLRSAPTPSRGDLAGSARGAANFVIWAMIRMRSARHPGEADGFPLAACCRALEGAGRDILSAGALPGRRREAAFRSLTADWLRRGGAELAPHRERLLRGFPDAGELVLREVGDEP